MIKYMDRKRIFGMRLLSLYFFLLCMFLAWGFKKINIWWAVFFWGLGIVFLILYAKEGIIKKRFRK